jgi:hypothetical protein
MPAMSKQPIILVILLGVINNDTKSAMGFEVFTPDIVVGTDFGMTVCITLLRGACAYFSLQVYRCRVLNGT